MTITCFPVTLPGQLQAQVQKTHRRRRLLRVDHQMLCGSVEAFTTRLQALGFSGRIQTVFVEQVNHTRPLLRSHSAGQVWRSVSRSDLVGPGFVAGHRIDSLLDRSIRSVHLAQIIPCQQM